MSSSLPRNAQSVVDEVLSSQGRSRRVVLRTPHFLTAPVVFAQTDLIATLPRSVAMTCEKMLPLRVFKNAGRQSWLLVPEGLAPTDPRKSGSSLAATTNQDGC